jgi:seryl-tRNA synthetase
MPDDERATEQVAFSEDLVHQGLGLPMGVAGIYAWSEGFERVLQLVQDAVTRLGAPDGATTVQFPPLIARETIDRVKYRQSFPQLLGDVTVWDQSTPVAEPEFESAPLVLAPAACYHLYPLVQTTQPEDGQTFDIQSWCFRNESAADPGRLSSFRMREFVRVGSREAVLDWRERWMGRARGLFEEAGLEIDIDAANDPFFGAPAARLQAAQQRAQGLKFELLAPITTPEPGAIMSFNYAVTHFADLYGLRLADGEVAHSGCVAFGLERIAFALMQRHGLDLDDWPSAARDALTG